MFTLGIDIGTSGVRTAVLHAGEAISSARAPHPAQASADIDAMLWWDAVVACLHAQMQNLRAEGHAPHDISRIAVDGTSGSMVLTDPDLHPVGPALMYNSKGFDAEAARIAPIAPATHITQGTNSALARALRLCATASRPPAHLLHQADFVAAHLMGRGGASDDNNALKTGFDPGAREWPAWMADLIDPALLPEVFAPGAPIGPVAPAICEMFGLSFQTQVHAGTTDSIAAFLACAPLEPGVAVTSLGSTLAVKLLSPVRIDDPAIGLYAHRLGDLWLVGGASNTGGAVLKAHFTDAELADLSIGMTAAPPTDLSYYPLVAPGERFPINDPHHAPVLSPRPADNQLFLKGMFEGMARIEALCYREMETRGAAYPSRIFTAGGGAQNEAWTDIRAAQLGTTPLKAQDTEASIGVARLAQ